MLERVRADLRRRRFLPVKVLPVLAVAMLGAPGLAAQDFIDVVDSTGLTSPIDDTTSHTYALRATGADVTMLVIRRFSQPIEDVELEIVSGQADDIGFVGGTLVTDIKPRCGGVGAVTGAVDVSDQVVIDGNEARVLLRARENCCCWTGWGSATEAGRQDAVLHWKVTLAEAETFRVNLTTFIPATYVEGPPQSRCLDRQIRGGSPIKKLFFGGDGDRPFSPTATTFRTRQRLTVVADQEADADGIEDGSYQPATGVTKAYAMDVFDLADPADADDGILGDCHLLHAVGQADPASSMSVESAAPTSGRTALIRLRGDADNPLVNNSPGIGWDIFVRIDATEDPVRYQVVGNHDGFPAYELYIDDQLVYGYRPGSPPFSFRDDLIKLFPPLDVSVLEEGTLP